MPRASAATLTRTKEPNFLTNSLLRPIGIELEICQHNGNIGRHLSNYLKAFRYDLVRDGSLSGMNPIEIVLWPQVGDCFLKAISQLCRALEDSDAQVNESCGLHVHVGGKTLKDGKLLPDYSPYDFRRFLQIYSTIEHDLYRWLVAGRRANSHYAAPMVRTYTNRLTPHDIPTITTDVTLSEGHRGPRLTHEFLASLYSCKEGSEIRKAIYQWLYFGGEQPPNTWETVWAPSKVKWKDGLLVRRSAIRIGQERHIPYQKASRYIECRYGAVNLHSWFYRGTIEWRQHEATLEPEDLLLWPLFCAWVVELASILTDSEAAQVTRLADLASLEWPRPLGGNRGLPQVLRTWLNKRITNQE